MMAEIIAIETMTALEKLFTIKLPEGIVLDHEPGQFVEFEYKGKMVSGKIKKIENGQIYI